MNYGDDGKSFSLIELLKMVLPVAFDEMRTSRFLYRRQFYAMFILIIIPAPTFFSAVENGRKTELSMRHVRGIKDVCEESWTFTATHYERRIEIRRKYEENLIATMISFFLANKAHSQRDMKSCNHN